MRSARNAHGRQRQRLIDACISALHLYGPSRTTVQKVTAFAKMSPGIVRFYFASKAAMLVASLQFLSAEFEEQLLVPVARLKSKPVEALELMVDLYLDPEIASPRKVSVWYAFWGEASSRQEYYDICGQKDESFAALVRDLIERLIEATSRQELDPDGIALGLIGVLEMLWQDFAFRTEAEIDRAAAKRRAMAYLRSIFPGQFAMALPAGDAELDRRLPGWVYADARLFAIEREALFRSAWQMAAHQSQIEKPGDFLGVDLGVERALLVRDAAGELRAFRNSCSESPHILIAAVSGHAEAIRCAIHGLQFEFDGSRSGGQGAAGLTPLDLKVLEGLILVRSDMAASPRAADPWREFAPPRGFWPLPPPSDVTIAADWKLVIEQWLESARATSPADSPGWSAQRYRNLLGAAADSAWLRRFIAPNHLIEVRPDGFSILQVVPSAPGQSRVRRFDYSVCEQERGALAARHLASRLSAYSRHGPIATVESTQQGIATFGHEAAAGIKAAAAAVAFRRQLVASVPMLAFARPPHEI
jgi:TetR/AcrR family transcriptional repressor of bet genes